MTDLSGKKFGKWTVLSLVKREKGERYFWLCRCECGTEKKVNASHLKRGASKSCGCLAREKLISRNYKHGHAISGKHSRLYTIWSHMVQRCTNPNVERYPQYGGRGIKVCDRWLNFENFIEDMGESYKDNLSLERVDVNGNYELSNCKWIELQEQPKNKQNTVKLEYNGKTYSYQELSKLTGIKENTLRARIKYLGWSVEKAVEQAIELHKGQNC